MSDHKPAAVVEPMVEAPLHVDRWEGFWIRISIVMLVVFTVAATISAVALNIQVPGVGGRIDPNNLDAPGSPFAEPGLRELAPGKYEAYIIAQIWQFNPSPITVPEDAEVTFYVTSSDIQHGFKVANTNINLMVLPGQISTLRHTFSTPGTYNIICHEYCGLGHHTMYGQIIVEPAGSTAPGAADEAAPGEAAPGDTAEGDAAEGEATGGSEAGDTVTDTVTSTVTGTVTSTVTDTVTGTVPSTATNAVTGTLPSTVTDSVTDTAPADSGN